MWENSNADQRVLNSSLKGFTKGPDAKGDSISATVTFPAEGGHARGVARLIPMPE